VKSSYRLAPAHRIIACVGVFVLLASSSACEKGQRLGAGRRGSRTLELSSDTVQLPAGVTLHDVTIKASQNVDFLPAELTAKVGDVVRFTVGDTRTHALVITAPTAEGKTALESTGQLRSPPLVAKGQAWVVSLKNVPTGTYTISCISHAGTATLEVK